MAQMRRNGHLLPDENVGNASQLTPSSSGARIVPSNLRSYQQGYQLYPFHIPPAQPRAYVQPQQNSGNVMTSEEIRRIFDISFLEDHIEDIWTYDDFDISFLEEDIEETWTDDDDDDNADVDMNEAVGIPTALHALESLPNSVVLPPHDEAAGCAVCIEEMCQEGKTTTKLPCGHVFHRDCVVLWLCNHNTCPLCRYTLPAEGTSLEA